MNPREYKWMRKVWDEWEARIGGDEMFGAYPAIPKKEVLWICDRCESTLLGTKYELVAHKWKTYAAGQLLLCPDCQPKVAKK